MDRFFIYSFFLQMLSTLRRNEKNKGVDYKILVKVTTVVKMIGGPTAWSPTYDDTHNADPNLRNYRRTK